MADPRPRIYVVAGNHKEYIEYINDKPFKVDYVFVTTPRMLKGLREIKGSFVGSFEDRIDIDEIKSEIEVIKLRMQMQKMIDEK
jgi:hypothetical protein